MGEHKTNDKSLAQKTFPAFPPLNRAIQLELGLSLLPKPNVLLMMPEEVRRVGDKTEIHTPDVSLAETGGWSPVPEGCEVHVLGEPLAPEKCDVTVTVVCHYGNVTLNRGGTSVLPMSIGRIDLTQFIAMVEGSIPESGLVVMS